MASSGIMLVVNFIKIRLAIDEVKHDRQGNEQLIRSPLYCEQPSYKILVRAQNNGSYPPMIRYFII
jgi:hypothetical protein